jgi:hypothetical protein
MSHFGVLLHQFLGRLMLFLILAVKDCQLTIKNILYNQQTRNPKT